MTTRRFNYTNCKRIPRQNVEVSVRRSADYGELSAIYDLDALDLPADALVVLEAYVEWTVMRFDYGTVGAQQQPEDTKLTEFDALDGLRVRLKVLGVGASAGLILAEADGIRPSDLGEPESARSFIAVRPSELGDVVWRVSFDESQPLLLVNERIGDWRSLVRNPGVRALILPEVLRQMLVKAIEIGADDESGGWPMQCERLVRSLGFEGFPLDADDEEAKDEWVDAVVRKFAYTHRLWSGVDELFGLEDEE